MAPAKTLIPAGIFSKTAKQDDVAFPRTSKGFQSGSVSREKSHEVHRDERVDFAACDTTLAKILRLGHPTRCSEMRGQMQEFICLGGMEE